MGGLSTQAAFKPTSIMYGRWGPGKRVFTAAIGHHIGNLGSYRILRLHLRPQPRTFAIRPGMLPVSVTGLGIHVSTHPDAFYFPHCIVQRSHLNGSFKL